MKPAPFEYHDPDTIDDALALLAEWGDRAAVLAGGQSLVPLLNLRLATPEVVVDLRRIALDHVRIGDHGVHVGAMVRAADLERNPAVGMAVPCLVEALHHVGHPQIRNRMTIGGSIAHADPASELPAVLVALEGAITLRSSARGERLVPATAFFTGHFTTVREPDEIVTEVHVPRFPGRTSFVEVSRRRGDFALVGACLALSMTDGVADAMRIGLSGVSDRPVRASLAERLLRGSRLSEAVLTRTAQAVSSELRPASDVHASGPYRAAVAGVIVRRGLAALAKSEA